MNQHFNRRLTFATTLGLFTCLTLIDRARAQTPVEAAWISAAPGNWTDVFRWNTFGFLPYPNNDDSDTYNVLIALDASPLITLDTDITIGNLHLASSFITGSKTLTVQNGFTWRGGGFSNGNGTLNSLKPIEMSGGKKFLKGFHVYSLDETSWVAGNVESQSGGVFHNQANSTFTTTFDGTWEAVQGPVPAEFINLGFFEKNTAIGTTHIAPDFTNAGNVSIETGTMKWSGWHQNTGGIEASKNTHLEFSGGYWSSPESSIVSDGTVSFTSNEDIVQLKGLFNVSQETTFAAKQTHLLPEIQLESAGKTVYIRKGDTHFDTQKTVGFEELFLLDRGQLLGSDPVSVQNKFLWASGTTLSGESPLFNVSLAEWVKLDDSGLPRILGGRPFVNFGKVFWSGGDMLVSPEAAIVNQNGAEFTIQENIIIGALSDEGKAQFINQGSLKVAPSVSVVSMDMHLINKGVVQFPNGRMIIGGPLDVDGGTLSVDNTTISTPNLSLVDSHYSGASTIRGNVSIGGQTSIHAPGTGLQIQGNIEFARDTALIISLTEQKDGTQLPPIKINGSASLDGAVLIEFHEEWLPESGRRIPVLESGSIQGRFRNIFPLRLNDTMSIVPVYEDHMIWLMPFHDGGDTPFLNVFLLNQEVMLTWPRHLTNYRVQAKQSLIDDEWTTLKRTLVNYMKLPIEEAGMIFRLIHNDAL